MSGSTNFIELFSLWVHNYRQCPSGFFGEYDFLGGIPLQMPRINTVKHQNKHHCQGRYGSFR